MATKLISLTAILLFIATWAEAAPPRNSRRPTTQRPTTKTAPKTTTAKPATKPGAVPLTPPPIPPEPKREEDAQTPPAPKAAIPHPTVAEEVKQPVTQPAASAPAAKAPTSPAPPKSTVTVAPDANGKYRLRYHFSNGETIRWNVEHRAKIVTTVGVSSETGQIGSTQTAETVTLSTKAWRVVETLPGGETRFIHLVEAIDMRQKLTGRQEQSYNSATDKDVPPIFAEAAKQVGVPLAEITIDARGNVLKREDKSKRPDGAPTNTITIVLPDEPLAIGESWTAPLDLTATDAAGIVKTIKARHKLTLEKVDGGIAQVRKETQILSPLNDPTIEAQVIQSEQTGQVSFDLRTGRIIEQHSDLDKEVFGFQGPESKLHYTAQFHEKLADEAAATAEAAAGNPLR